MINSNKFLRAVPSVLSKTMARNTQKNVRVMSVAAQSRRNAVRQPLANGRMTASLLPTPTTPIHPARYMSTPALPEHIRVNLPALSPTMESGTVVSWEKQEGDQLSEGDLLAEIETDKATMGFETPEEGWLAKILMPAGSRDIPLGKLLCIIVENEADIAAFKDFKADEESAPALAATPAAPTPAAPTPTPTTPSTTPATPTSTPSASGIVFASPYAKKIAAEKGLDLRAVAADIGKGGSTDSIVQGTDVEQWLVAARAGPKAAAPTPTTAVTTPAGDHTAIPVTGMRATIAKRLQEAKSTIPEYYLSVDVEMDAINALRASLNTSLAASGTKISVNDFVIKASALACKAVPECNSSWAGDVIRQYHSVDVSVAVSTEGGLITPIVFGACTKGLSAISSDVRRLAAKAREGKLTPAEFQGGTFSVSNLGMGGVKSFVAVLNAPQSCILAVGESRKAVVPCDGELGYRTCTQVTVTLTCDHRTVDGAVGAKWLQAFKGYLQEPHTMLL